MDYRDSYVKDRIQRTRVGVSGPLAFAAILVIITTWAVPDIEVSPCTWGATGLASAVVWGVGLMTMRRYLTEDIDLRENSYKLRARVNKIVRRQGDLVLFQGFVTVCMFVLFAISDVPRWLERVGLIMAIALVALVVALVNMVWWAIRHRDVIDDK